MLTCYNSEHIMKCRPNIEWYPFKEAKKSGMQILFIRYFGQIDRESWVVARSALAFSNAGINTWQNIAHIISSMAHLLCYSYNYSLVLCI